MLFALLSAPVACFFCTHQVEISANVPEDFSYDVVEGDLICINSTVDNLAVLVGGRSFLDVHYFYGEEELERAGKFTYPSEQTGVVFPNVHGHVEIHALLTGSVQISAFAFPSDCERGLFVTTLDEENFILKRRFKAHDTNACFWMPHHASSLYDVPVTAETRRAIKICDKLGCRDAVDDASGVIPVSVSSNSYVKIDLSNPGFVEDFPVRIAVKEKREFLKVSDVITDLSISEIDLVNPMEHQGVSRFGEANGGREHRGGGAGYESSRRRKEETSRMITLEIICVIAVTVAIVMLIVQCFFFVATSKKRKERDSSQDRLLSEHRENRMPHGQFPAPVYGQYYAPSGAVFQPPGAKQPEAFRETGFPAAEEPV